MTDLIATVTEALDKLAAHGSARKIANFLAAEQCAGHRNAGASCPVARYVTRNTGRTVYVDGESWFGGFDDADVHPVPGNVSAFVDRFDKGWYPELIAAVS
jgi:hypothetical protein